MSNGKTQIGRDSPKGQRYSDEVLRQFERDLIRLIRESRDRVTGNIRDETAKMIVKYSEERA
jgi:hypothetical protein